MPRKMSATWSSSPLLALLARVAGGGRGRECFNGGIGKGMVIINTVLDAQQCDWYVNKECLQPRNRAKTAVVAKFGHPASGLQRILPARLKNGKFKLAKKENGANTIAFMSHESTLDRVETRMVSPKFSRSKRRPLHQYHHHHSSSYKQLNFTAP